MQVRWMVQGPQVQGQIRLVMVGVAIAVIAACTGTPQPVSPEQLVIYPPPPDTARIQFLTAISDERDIGGGGRSLLDKIVGRDDAAARAISKPYGMAVHGGVLYVCDEDIMGLDLVNLETRTIRFFRPSGPGGLRMAVNCYVDDAGNLYVTDTGKRQVVLFDSTRSFVAAFGGEDGGRPADVAVGGDRIYVSHLGQGLGIRAYERETRRFLFSFPDRSSRDTLGVVTPANITVTDDAVYASDLLKQRVFVFTLDGEFVRYIGRPGTGPSTFSRPKGVAVDRDGLVYVVDAAFANVQVFAPTGRLLMHFGGPGGEPGNMWLPAKVVIDYDHLDYFQPFVGPGFELRYLIFVTNQYGPAKINVYGFVGPAEYVIPAQP